MDSSRRLVFLIRHGQTEWNQQGRWQGHIGPGLNIKGIEQIRSAAEKLKKFRIERIVSSDTLRAKESAEILGEYLNTGTIIYNEKLRERMMGGLAGLTEAEILHRHPEIVLTKGLLGRYNIEGSEQWELFVRRSTSAFLEITQKYEGNIAIVTHGGVIDQMIILITGKDTYPIVPNGNITSIEEKKSSGTLRLLQYSL
ncbi:MAG: histidine phosphatase family protein [Thermoplasmata archaeon]